MFDRIFNGEFNIFFYSSKKDQYDLCKSFKNADEQGKANLVEAYNLHQKDKELSRKEKEANKINVSSSHVAIYDLQILPFLEVKYRHFTTKANLTATTSPS